MKFVDDVSLLRKLAAKFMSLSRLRT